MTKNPLGDINRIGLIEWLFAFCQGGEDANIVGIFYCGGRDTKFFSWDGRSGVRRRFGWSYTRRRRLPKVSASLLVATTESALERASARSFICFKNGTRHREPFSIVVLAGF